MKITSLRLAIAALTAFGFTTFCSAQAKLAGDWTGTLEANGATLHVAWHAVSGSDGTITSTFDNADEGIYGIKVKTTSLKGNDLTMIVDDTPSANGQQITVRGEFEGVVSADGNEVNGTWTQTEPVQPPLQVHFKRGAAQAPAAQPAAQPAASQPSVAGDWAGTLKAGSAELRLVLHITAAKDGSLTATLDSIDQGANGIPINTVTLKDGKLNLDVQAVHGTYDGTVNKDASEIDGTWSQGQPMELNFKRAQPQAAAPAPKPAAPSDIDGTWQGSLDTPGGALRILFKIVNMDTGLTATAQSPDQSPAWMPTTSVTRTGNKLTIVMKALGASFEGQINDTKDTINGTFTQGASIPLVLKKG